MSSIYGIIIALCASQSQSLKVLDPQSVHHASNTTATGVSSMLSITDVVTPFSALWWFEEVINMGFFKMGVPGILAVLVFLSPIDAMTRILKEGDVGKLPLMPYSAMMLNGALWTTYGLLKNAPGVWAPNSIGFVCGVIFTTIYMKHCPTDANWLPGKALDHFKVIAVLITVALAAAALAQLDVAINIIGLMGQAICVIMFAGPLAAVKTIIAEKSTKSLPLAFTLLSFCNCFSWLIYGWFFMHDMYIYVPNGLGFALSIGQLGLFATYGVQQ
eukprot:gnl/MRDRNA2_/MRDRNA2_207795_c0_seq1.p1 gnl/MRDRNA2_/MRDRNA2_207795_c0~~gnl/MRDRNA2_/MRDRNA2_207795_c0_seq1.p1  ORF type:complete len:299 (+),score=52.71 gnl/MRDRNA2_/MRDRNA2_207795_c0_seq1:79-897(+)